MSSVGSISTADQFTINLLGSTSSGSSSNADVSSSILGALYNQISVSVNVGEYSKLKSVASKLTDDQASELSDLLASANKAMKAGDFNPNTIVSSASDDLKSALSDKGVDLKKALSNMYVMYLNSSSKSATDYSSLFS